MLRVLGCITGQHDLRLVGVAAILCVFACVTAITMVERARATPGRSRLPWLAAAGIVAGSGIWGTHFLAMLAFRPGLPVTYDLWLTGLSIILAMTLCGGGFAVALRRGGTIPGGILTGAAIALMHFVGMAALRAPAIAVWDGGYVLAAILIALLLTPCALHVALRGTMDIRRLARGAALFTAAICGLHFTAMAAVTYLPAPVVMSGGAALEPGSIAIAVTALAILVVALGLVGALLDAHLARRAVSEAARLRQHIVELEATKQDLELTSANLSKALVEAAAASQIKSRFLAVMSHELRTPLNAILGFSEIMVLQTFGPVGDPRYQEYASHIHASGGHLLALINDVLDLTRLDAGYASLEEVEMALPDVMAEALRMVEPQARTAGVVLREGHDSDLPALWADPRRLCQVLVNLLANGVKFTPEHGSVTLSAQHTEEGVIIAVADTGIGMAPEDIPRALERFGQIDNRLERKYEGSGLGLPLARELIELHGGSLSIRSALDVGTTVTLWLPASRIVERRQTA